MRLMCVVMLFFFLCSCRTMQPVAHDNWALTNQVESGDTVEVTTKDGRTQRFMVAEVTPTALIGAGVQVDRGEIQTLKVLTVQKGRTISLAVIGGVVALVLLVAAAFASSNIGGM